jgi:hypothetical protein
VGYWKKHQKPEGEEALQQIAELGWRIEDPPKYYTVKCPCGDHQRQVHLTPSNPYYFRQAVRWAQKVCSAEPKEEP